MSNEESDEVRERRAQNIQRQQRDEQALAQFADVFPPMWRRMYMNLVAEGFKEDEALRLVSAHVHGAGGGKFCNG